MLRNMLNILVLLAYLVLTLIVIFPNLEITKSVITPGHCPPHSLNQSLEGRSASAKDKIAEKECNLSNLLPLREEEILHS